MPVLLPMLAQAGTGRPPAGDEWLHEIKWDGVRAVLGWDGETVSMRSRTGKDMAATYPEIAAAAVALEPGVILDGEIVTLSEAGVPSFEVLQRRMNLQAGSLVADAVAAVPVTYVVFDLPHRGDSMLAVPLERRLAMLNEVEMPAGFVLSDTYDDPDPLWAFAAERGLEGVISKRRQSFYRPGVRSPDWLKSVVFRSLRAVVVGFTTGDGGRRGSFGALVLGLPDGSHMRWIGSVGSGFSASEVRSIRAALDEMVVDESPFIGDEATPRDITWVAPELVAVVQYKQWTGAGRLRGPSFKGFTDYPISEVSWATEGPDAPGG